MCICLMEGRGHVMRQYAPLCMGFAASSHLGGLLLKDTFEYAGFIGWCLGFAFNLAALAFALVDDARARR